MGILISRSDFKGAYDVPTDNFSEAKLDQYIEDYEESYIISLLGAVLGQAFIADLSNGVPQDQKFLIIFNKFYFDSLNLLLKSEGMKVMLAKFIYWEYMRDNQVQKTIGGSKRNIQANSESSVLRDSNIYKVLNEAIGSYQAIQYYVFTYNPEGYDYNDYNGVELSKTTIV